MTARSGYKGTDAGSKVEQRGAAAGGLEGCSNMLEYLAIVAVGRLERDGRGSALRGAAVG